MKDSPLHGLSVVFNGKPRYAVSDVVQGAHKINMDLAKNHIIQEPSTMQHNITETIFNKFTSINEIIEKKDLAVYLKSLEIQKSAELQSVKTKLKELTTSKSKDEQENDLIGG